MAISGGDQGQVHIWNLQDRTSRAVADRHSATVTQVCIGAHSQRAVSASSDHSLKVWDLTTGQCLQTLVGHTGVVIAADMSDDGSRIVSGSFDEELNLRLWEAEKPHPAISIADHFARVDSVTLIHGAQVAVTTSQFSPYISLWNLADAYEYVTLTAASDVCAIAVTSDHSKAVSLAADRGGYRYRPSGGRGW
jgi:WD40 repeat protein